MEQEPMYEAWERYKDLLRWCPQHHLPKWMIVQILYNGLLANTQIMIDAASGGSMNNKNLVEVDELIKAMESNNYERWSDYAKKGARLLDADKVSSLKAQVAAMRKQIARMSVNAVHAPM